MVFFGTADFAVPSLTALTELSDEVVAVVTAPDRRGGRGRKQIIASPVKKIALEKGLRVLQPPNLKAPEFIEELKSLQADIFAVVAFRMLPQVVWDMPPLGTINLHASLLPKYRGAAPINRAIIDGARETGLSVFKLKQEIDTGDLIDRIKVEIGDDETAGELHDRMAPIGAKFLADSIDKIRRGDLKLIPQDHSMATPAPKIFNEDGLIDFAKPITEIYNLIRGLSPYPGAYTFLNGSKFKIFEAGKHEINTEENTFLKAGKLETDQKRFLHLYGSGGYIACKKVQLQGKRRMDIGEFLNGYGDQLPKRVDQ